MFSLGIGLSIIGIILEVATIFWALRTVITWKRYYEQIRKSEPDLPEKFKQKRKEQFGVASFLIISAILQIVGLVI
jgi:hypothetical protein